MPISQTGKWGQECSKAQRLGLCWTCLKIKSLGSLLLFASLPLSSLPFSDFSPFCPSPHLFSSFSCFSPSFCSSVFLHSFTHSFSIKPGKRDSLKIEKCTSCPPGLSPGASLACCPNFCSSSLTFPGGRCLCSMDRVGEGRWQWNLVQLNKVCSGGSAE